MNNWKKNIAILIVIAFVMALTPFTFADYDSAIRVDSLEALAEKIWDDNAGNEIELVLADGDYTLASHDAIEIPEGRSVTIYGNNVTIRHQPYESTAIFDVPNGALLCIVGVGSAQLVIENTTLDKINEAHANREEPKPEEPHVEYLPENGEGYNADGEENYSPDESSSESEQNGEPREHEHHGEQELHSASDVCGIASSGELYVYNVSFKGFNAGQDYETVRGLAIYNEGSAIIQNVSVTNVSGNPAENSIYNSGYLEIDADDSLTQDSFVENHGEFYSKAQRAADLEAEQNQIQEQEPETQEEAYPEENEPVPEEHEHKHEKPEHQDDEDLKAKISEAWGYAASADRQEEEAANQYAEACTIYTLPQVLSSDLEDNMNAANAAYNIADALAVSAETLLTQYPTNPDLSQAAGYARGAANAALQYYEDICAMYADLYEVEAELPAGTYIIQSPSEVSSTVLQGTGAYEQDIDAQGGETSDEVEQTVSAPTPTVTPAQTYTTTYTNTQDTSAKQAITVQASWNDNNNANSRRPNSIQVSLYKDGGLYMNATVTAASGWSYTFSNLPVGSSYRLEETSVADYTTYYSTSGNTVSLAHTYTGSSTTSTSTYSNGTTGAYSGTQTTTYANTNTGTSTTQKTATTQTASSAQSGTGTQTTSNASSNVSVTPGPSSTPVTTATPVPTYTATSAPSAAASGSSSTEENTATQSRSSFHAWVWIVVLVLSAGAIAGVLLYLNKLKKEREAEARARARARRRAQMQAQKNIDPNENFEFDPGKVSRSASERSASDFNERPVRTPSRTANTGASAEYDRRRNYAEQNARTTNSSRESTGTVSRSQRERELQAEVAARVRRTAAENQSRNQMRGYEATSNQEGKRTGRYSDGEY